MKTGFAKLCIASSLVIVGCSCASAPAAREAATKSGRSALVNDAVEFRNMPFVDATPIRLGGFSGLIFDRRTDDGMLEFTTHTDRGPNLEVVRGARGERLRPFVWPSFQPEWSRFRYDPTKHEVTVLDRVGLTNQDGSKATGLPNAPAAPGDAEETADTDPRDGDRGFEKDEIPVDAFSRPLGLDPRGLDLESIRRDADGTVWMSEEYRPSILHYASNGRLISRWIPRGVDRKFGEPTLPAHFARRRANRGFEGIALWGPSVFAFLQTGVHGDHGLTRILEVAKKSGAPLAEYAYEFDATPDGYPVVDKIGDAVSIGPGRFLVIEQNGAVGQHAYHRIYEIDVRGATDLLTSRVEKLKPKRICKSTVSKAGAKCVITVRKKLVLDIVAAVPELRGHEKIEGIDLIDASTIALVTDNDFAVVGKAAPSSEAPAAGADQKAVLSRFVGTAPTMFAVVRLAVPLDIAHEP